MIQLRKPVVLATGLALAALAGIAQAADGDTNILVAQAPTPAAPVAAAPASGSSGSGLTWNGITLFGTIDAGYAHQTHGAPFSMNSAQGLNYVLARNSNQSVSSAAQNGLSQSVISRHLQQLTQAGLTTTRREGYYVLYALDQTRLAQIAAALTGLATPGD